MPFQNNFLQSNNASLAYQHTNGLTRNEKVKDEEKSPLFVNTRKDDLSSVSFFQQNGEDFDTSDDKNINFFVSEQQRELFCHEDFPVDLKDKVVINDNFDEQRGGEEQQIYQITKNCQNTDLQNQIYDEQSLDNNLTSSDNGEIDTLKLAQHISQELKRYSIPQAIFAQRVLCR